MDDFKKYSTKEVVKKRVSLINASYHTRVSVKVITEGILSVTGLDTMIKNGSSKAVERITKCGDKHYFVFATKYCCFGNPKKFPIYDSLSAKVLQWFYDWDNGYRGKCDDLCGNNTGLSVDKRSGTKWGGFKFTNFSSDYDYESYRKCIDAFISHYRLEVEDYKELDKFLWLVGKNMPD